MTSTQPRVSVITPFLDPPLPFFEEAIASVHAQTFTDWELLLVDDGSQAPVAAFARDHAAWHADRVRYLEFPGHSHRGLAAARNLGLSHARAEYAAMLDADDVWAPVKLAEQIRILDESPEIGCVYGTTLYWYGWTGKADDERRDRVEGHVVHVRSGFSGADRFDPPRLLTLLVRGEARVPSISSLFLRLSLALELGGPEESFTLYEDQTLLAKLCIKAPVVLSVRCWDSYRQHEGSLWTRSDPTMRRQARRQYLEWLGKYLELEGIDDSELRRAVQRELCAVRLWPIGHYANGIAKRIERISERLQAP